MAFAALTGIGSAFAFNRAPKLAGGATYYSYYDGDDVKWSTTRPTGANANCVASNLACTITSTSANVTSDYINEFPPQHSVLNQNGKSHPGM